MPTVNFEIRVADFSKEHFALSVIAAPKLSPELARKSFPIPKRDLERIAGPDLSLAVSSKDQVLRAPGSSANLDVQAFGEQLFRILIWDHQDRELIASWEHFAEQAEHARCLRLCLANQVPALPWEALRDPYKLNGSLARQFSVVRYIPASPPIQPLDIGTEPLRMLVVFADPDGDLARASAIQRERTAIQEALGGATARGELSIDFVEAGTGSTLDRIKAKADAHAYHVLHYFGHGNSEGQGWLQFEGPRPAEAAPASWEDLHQALGSALSSLRLVILNACELAQPGEGLVRYTPFTNLAACFLNAGAATVVAMQYPIRTDTATTFTRAFYEQLAAHPCPSAGEVEAAVVEGRKAIIGKQNAVEWITPVLFTRMQDDLIFRRPDDRSRAWEEARVLIAAGAWGDAAEKVEALLLDEPKSREGLRLKQKLLDQAATMIEQMDPRGGEIVDALE